MNGNPDGPAAADGDEPQAAPAGKPSQAEGDVGDDDVTAGGSRAR